MKCNLYKVVLSVTNATETQQVVFWGYHLGESQARDAAIVWGEKVFLKSKVDIVSVDMIS